jgi:SAM-dependent methyltransferase
MSPKRSVADIAWISRPAMTEQTYVEGFSAVPADRYTEAQAEERRYWNSENRLVRRAVRYFSEGLYQWRVHRALTSPFRVDPTRPDNFDLQPDEIAGAVVLDVGCGPISRTLCLVHCATVHAVDPLMDHYRKLQPFGWRFFASVHACGAETLPFEAESIDVVHCRNVLDHTRDADQILSEIARVLRPAGSFLLNCDLRDRGAGPAHPYRWSRDVFETRVFAQFEPVKPPVVIQVENESDASGRDPSGQRHWVCRLRKR